MKRSLKLIVGFFSITSMGLTPISLTCCHKDNRIYWKFKDYQSMGKFTQTEKFNRLTSKKPTVQDYDPNGNNYVPNSDLGKVLESCLTEGDMGQMIVYSLYNYFSLVSIITHEFNQQEFNVVKDVKDIFISIAKTTNTWDISCGFTYLSNKYELSYKHDAPLWEDNNHFVDGLEIPSEQNDILPYEIFYSFFNIAESEETTTYWNTTGWYFMNHSGSTIVDWIEAILNFWEKNNWVTLWEWQYKIIFPNWTLEHLWEE